MEEEVILDPEARRQYLSWQIPHWIEEGYSRTRCYEAVRGTPYGIRRSDFFELWRQVEGIERGAERSRYVDPEDFVTDRIRGVWTEPLSTKYADRLRVTYVDPSGVRRSVSFLYMHDDYLTRGEIEDRGEDVFSSKYVPSGATIVDVSLRASYMSP